MSVLLVNMPFAHLRWPNIGLSLLKSSLTVREIPCELKNLCFPFAERVGYDLYDWIADHFAFVLGGEHLFAKDYFGDRLPPTDGFWNDVILDVEPLLDAKDRADFETVAAAIPGFLDDCMATIDFSRYRLVGFTTSYQQAFPSLCLAKRIKQRYPDVQIAFGGAACEGVMGAELIRQFPELDFVFLGEADLTFPHVVGKLLDGTLNDSPLPDGMLCRDYSKNAPDYRPLSQRERVRVRGSVLGISNNDQENDINPSPDPNRVDSFTPNAPHPNPLPEGEGTTCMAVSEKLTVSNLDELPYPDFDDYFGDLRESSLRDEVCPLLFFETSRGCWWGERRQCSFCGLNGHSLQFRCKTPKRAADELVWLVERYGVKHACCSDNIFAKEYFDTFLPLLKESGVELSFEYEMKANQKKEHVLKLVDAGLGAAQLGIETLSTPILKMLSKGATARHNLQVLKWYTEAGVEVKWNVLYGFPGEPIEEYAKLTELVPLVAHFYPPLAVGRVRVDRFAPYHRNPQAYGIENLRPFRGFRFLYPFDDESLRKLAYYHEFDFADHRDVHSYVGPFLEQVALWQQNYGIGTLRAFDREDGVLLLTDTRTCAVEFQYRLSGWQRELYLFCDTAKTSEQIAAQFPGADVFETLQRWIDHRIMLDVDGLFFATALSGG